MSALRHLKQRTRVHAVRCMSDFKGVCPKGATPASNFDTLCVHAGAAPDPVTGARCTPIYQTTSFNFKDTDEAARRFNLQEFGPIYSRLTNPTNDVLEAKVAALEGGTGAVALSSGHAAQLVAMHNLMSPGDHFVSATKLYGGSVTQFAASFQRFGWNVSMVNPDDMDAMEAAITPKTKCMFMECLANPGGVVVDIEKAGQICKKHGIPLIVDNTSATPYLCRPFEWGANIIVHSGTKYMGGHGNSIGGFIVENGSFDWAQNDKFPHMVQPSPSYHGMSFNETFGPMGIPFVIAARAVGLRDLGPCMSPFNAFLIIQGIETLGLRMPKHCENSLAVAKFLEQHPKVAWVSYAGLESSPYHQLAKKFTRGQGGALFTFGLKGGYEAGVKFASTVEMLSLLANLGDVRSLVTHPASTTHRQLTAEQQKACGATGDVVRLAIGIETAEDIIKDIDQALAKC